MIDTNWLAALLPLIGAGFVVGFLVGLTGVGGGGVRRCLDWALNSPRTWQPPPEYLATEVRATVSAIVTGELPAAVRSGRGRTSATRVPDAL